MKMQIEQFYSSKFSASPVLFLSLIKNKAEKHAERGRAGKQKD
jgi:hypothetical protein